MKDQYLPKIPEKYQKSFLYPVLLSITVEINKQISKIKKQNKKPRAILLGKFCSIQFCHEQTQTYNINKAPEYHLDLPVIYNCDKIIGVYVSTSPTSLD